MPLCSYCDGHMTPVWALPMTFQCDCGYSGQLDVSSVPSHVADALIALWESIDVQREV